VLYSVTNFTVLTIISEQRFNKNFLYLRIAVASLDGNIQSQECL